MLITLNSKTSNLACINAGSFPITEHNDIRKLCREIVDGISPEKYAKSFIFINFTCGSQYLMIAQKYIDNNYACYITFGYDSKAIVYERKVRGEWTQ